MLTTTILSTSPYGIEEVAIYMFLKSSTQKYTTPFGTNDDISTDERRIMLPVEVYV
jgi:hypothetical protein